MVERVPKRLRDVRDASAEILDFTRGKTYDDDLGDRGLRLIVERLFEIIGEAMSAPRTPTWTMSCRRRVKWSACGIASSMATTLSGMTSSGTPSWATFCHSSLQ